MLLRNSAGHIFSIVLYFIVALHIVSKLRKLQDKPAKKVKAKNKAPKKPAKKKKDAIDPFTLDDELEDDAEDSHADGEEDFEEEGHFQKCTPTCILLKISCVGEEPCDDSPGTYAMVIAVSRR